MKIKKILIISIAIGTGIAMISLWILVLVSLYFYDGVIFIEDDLFIRGFEIIYLIIALICNLILLFKYLGEDN